MKKTFGFYNVWDFHIGDHRLELSHLKMGTFKFSYREKITLILK